MSTVGPPQGTRPPRGGAARSDAGGEHPGARVIDGKALAADVIRDIADRVGKRIASGRQPPGLAVVLVGENAASKVYVGNKRRTTEAAGMRSFAHDLPASIAQDDLRALNDRL